MGMGAFDRNVEKLSRQDIGSTDAACNHGSPCAVGSRVRPLGAAKSEFHDSVSACRIDDA